MAESSVAQMFPPQQRTVVEFLQPKFPGALVLGDRLILPVHRIDRVRSIEVTLSQPWPYVAEVAEVSVVRAAQIIERETGDLAGYLDPFDILWDAESATLATQASTVTGLEVQVQRLRDGCVQLLAIACGMRAHEEVPDPADSALARQLKLSRMVAHAHRVLLTAWVIPCPSAAISLTEREWLLGWSRTVVALTGPGARDRALAEARRQLEAEMNLQIEVLLLGETHSQRAYIREGAERLASAMRKVGPEAVLAGFRGALDGDGGGR